MTMQEETATLRAIPMFASIDAAQLRLLSFTSERVAFLPGEAFIKQGDPGDTAYVVVKGEAEILIEGPDGPTIVASAGPNSILGEVSLLLKSRRIATVRAKTLMCCLELSSDVFYQLSRAYPDFAIGVMRDLAARLEQANMKLEEALRTGSLSGGRSHRAEQQ
jgi:CRP/FNR family cyclic AMP-dependent transcriptional regulator